jgi:hypothetical protein
MLKRVWSLSCCLAAVVFLLVVQAVFPSPALGAGATTSVHIIKYAADGVTVLEEKTVDYKWMEENLEVYGDGETHYYHQGPVFEGDPWDPDETQNLKDKGAVKGTAVKDLCDLVGGMAEGDEVMLISVDKWHTQFAYANIYEPLDVQGVIGLCWFNGRDADEGEHYGTGYPANNAYSSALQIVFMSEHTNQEGKHVFGNTDMRMALPQEKYQHFFEGLPSTNGLSGKWVNEIRIYSGGVPENVDIFAESHADEPDSTVPWLPLVSGLAGITLVGWYFYMRKKQNEKR